MTNQAGKGDADRSSTVKREANYEEINWPDPEICCFCGKTFDKGDTDASGFGFPVGIGLLREWWYCPDCGNSEDIQEKMLKKWKEVIDGQGTKHS